MNKEHIKAIIFDFDGVICQSENYKIHELYNYFIDLGLKITIQELSVLIGGTFHTKEKIYDEIFGNQAIYWKNKIAIMKFRVSIIPLNELITDGIEETIKWCKQHDLLIGIGSNSYKLRLQDGLESCGILEYINYIGSAFDSGHLKPDPYIYKLCMKKLGVLPNECMIVEDSALGIHAGKEAGAFVVALKDEEMAINQSEADVVIVNIKQLMQLLG